MRGGSIHFYIYSLKKMFSTQQTLGSDTDLGNTGMCSPAQITVVHSQDFYRLSEDPRQVYMKSRKVEWSPILTCVLYEEHQEKLHSLCQLLSARLAHILFSWPLLTSGFLIWSFSTYSGHRVQNIQSESEPLRQWDKTILGSFSLISEHGFDSPRIMELR